MMVVEEKGDAELAEEEKERVLVAIVAAVTQRKVVVMEGIFVYLPFSLFFFFLLSN